jgi:predicted nucleic acid-binding protein
LIPGPLQFWDTSAVIALISKDAFASAAVQAMNSAEEYWAWEWLQIEAESALRRRRSGSSEFKDLNTLLNQFQFLSLDSNDFPEIRAILDSHRLRSADAGHLFCLRKAHRLFPRIQFVCFDQELNQAARKEGIAVFGEI